MNILNYKNWLILEEASANVVKDDPKGNIYTIESRPSFIYRISHNNMWQYQKANSNRKDIWNWVLNMDSVKALNKKYRKDLKVFTHIDSKELTDPDKIKIVNAIKEQGKALGWTDNAISSFIGNVGRENNFQWKYIIGPHDDPKNEAKNFGIISWQGSRLKNVQNALKKVGLLQGNGSAKKDVASVKAMVRFVDSELNSERGNSALMRQKGATTKQISDMLYKYIRYSSSAPYNEPDSRFHVEKNHYWAAAAKLAGLINYV